MATNIQSAMSNNPQYYELDRANCLMWACIVFVNSGAMVLTQLAMEHRGIKYNGLPLSPLVMFYSGFLIFDLLQAKHVDSKVVRKMKATTNFQRLFNKAQHKRIMTKIDTRRTLWRMVNEINLRKSLGNLDRIDTLIKHLEEKKNV